MEDKTFAAMDRIHITDLRVSCIIGLNDWERTTKQDVVINICLYADLSKAAQSDNIADSIDYRQIKKRVVEEVQQSSFKLIEALANAVVRICLSHAAVQAVRVKVEKPGALRYARTVGVEFFRTK
ncbi:MAG: dihydroneopterin aldolase [Planctomycetaceae bacterium]|nr:dihydroneopterin aldolase [Planctomycetaceae bacterium]